MRQPTKQVRMRVIERGRFAFVRQRAGVYNVYRRKRTRHYFVGHIRRQHGGVWISSGRGFPGWLSAPTLAGAMQDWPANAL